MKLSNQAMGALMMALQKCLMEETDIIELLRDMDFDYSPGMPEVLMIVNPPIISLEGTTFKSVEELAEYSMETEEGAEETS